MYKYAVGDCAKCNWGSGSYTAKVVEVNPSRKNTPYLIHYLGWKSRWDEWVPESRLTGPGTGNKHKHISSSTAAVQKKRTEHATAPLRMRKKEPELMRILDGSKIVYINDKNRKFRSMADIRRYCIQNEFEFKESSYDFSLPDLSPPKPEETLKKSAAVKAKKTSASPNSSKTAAKRPTKAQEKNELTSDLRQIQKGLTGKSRKKGSKEMDRPEETVPVRHRMNVIVEPISEMFGVNFHHDMRPSRQKRPNQRYTDLLAETEQAKKRRMSGFSPVTGAPLPTPSAGKPPTGKKSPAKSKPQPTHSQDMKARSRVKTKVTPRKKVQEAPVESDDESRGRHLSSLMMPELEAEDTTEFIEIQEPEPMIADQPKGTIGRVNKGRKPAGKGEVKHAPPPTLQEEPHQRYSDDSSFGINPTVTDADLTAELDEHFECFFEAPHIEPDVHVGNQRAMQEALRGIKVTGNAPPVEAPSRVFMQLKGPDLSKKARVPSLRMGPNGLEYAPPVHVGGRGHFGVAGSGQPIPQPVIQEKREHFCVLPQGIAGDHCYGKTPPPVGGTNLSPVGPTVYGAAGRGQGRRVHLTGFGQIRPGQMRVRVLPSRSVSPPGFRETTEAAAGLAEASREFYDEEEELAALEDYGGMEVVGFADSPGTHHPQTIASTVNLMPQRQTPMLSDKLPANILEGVYDADLTGEPSSIDIH